MNVDEMRDRANLILGALGGVEIPLDYTTAAAMHLLAVVVGSKCGVSPQQLVTLHRHIATNLDLILETVEEQEPPCETTLSP